MCSEILSRFGDDLARFTFSNIRSGGWKEKYQISLSRRSRRRRFQTWGRLHINLCATPLCHFIILFYFFKELKEMVERIEINKLTRRRRRRRKKLSHNLINLLEMISIIWTTIASYAK